MEQNPKTVSRDFVFTYVLNFPNTTWKQKSTSKTQDKNEDHILLNLVLQVWKLLLMPFFFFATTNKIIIISRSISLPPPFSSFSTGIQTMLFFNFFPVLPVLLEHFIFNSQLIWRSAMLKFNRLQC